MGLAAAAHLLERGASVGATVAEWAHVRVFSPWEYNVDAAAHALLERGSWTAPDPDYLPTGGELIRDYLAPLAAHPAIAPHLRLGAEVVAVSRQSHSKLASEGCDAAPFVLLWRDRTGKRHRAVAHAVIDAFGTWIRPNPIGLDGLPVEGEVENASHVAYGIPDVLGERRADHASRYGRAPTFLMTTGYEQVRSVVAELAGDPVAAREVRMKLPETGVCRTAVAPGAASDCCGAATAADAGCCGGAPTSDASACCAAEETTTAAGEAGCGCSAREKTEITE